jgi:hypothetical protein
MTYTCGKTTTGRIRHEVYIEAVKMATAPAWDEIARLAYAYWEVRGKRDDSADEDWYRAERDLWARFARSRR